MGWKYHTSLSPNDKNDSFNESFNFLLKNCMIDKEILEKNLIETNCYRFIMRTDGENDKIVCNDGKIFLKSRFFMNKNFKQSLIQYYKPIGIFMKGPKEIIEKVWVIELTRIYNSHEHAYGSHNSGHNSGYNSSHNISYKV